MTSTCEFCETKFKEWTRSAYNEREVLQIGCWNCGSWYNVVEGELFLARQDYKHFIFWKDLYQRWSERLAM